MTDLQLTPAQAKTLAAIAERHSNQPLAVQPPIVGAIAVRVAGKTYIVDYDGSET